MKKFLFLAGLAFAAGLTFVSCDNKKAAADVQAEANMLTDSVKAEAIELFRTVKIENDVILQEIEVLPEGVRLVPVKYFVPFEWADNAQTLEQKCALLGCYTVDAQYDKYVYGGNNNPEGRHAVIAKLFAETNIASDAAAIDSISKLGREEYIKEIQSFTLKNFEQALEDNNADSHVTMLIYSLVEGTLNQQYANEQRGEYDQAAMIKDIKKSKKAMENVVKLINKLQPYYESLNSLVPMTEKINAILSAADETAEDEAFINYNNYIKELRGKLNAQLEK